MNVSLKLSMEKEQWVNHKEQTPFHTGVLSNIRILNYSAYITPIAFKDNIIVDPWMLSVLYNY